MDKSLVKHRQQQASNLLALSTILRDPRAEIWGTDQIETSVGLSARLGPNRRGSIRPGKLRSRTCMTRFSQIER